MNERIDIVDDLLYERSFSEKRCENFDVCVVEALCEMFDKDWSKDKLNLSNHIPLDVLNNGMRFHMLAQNGGTYIINFGDYTVAICGTEGMIFIYGDREDHEAGLLSPPPSMR